MRKGETISNGCEGNKDALFQEICEHPDRDTTGKRMEEVEEERERLKGVERALDEKLEYRKKECFTLIDSIHRLQVRGEHLRASSSLKPLLGVLGGRRGGQRGGRILLGRGKQRGG